MSGDNASMDVDMAITYTPYSVRSFTLLYRKLPFFFETQNNMTNKVVRLRVRQRVTGIARHRTVAARV